MTTGNNGYLEQVRWPNLLVPTLPADFPRDEFYDKAVKVDYTDGVFTVNVDLVCTIKLHELDDVKYSIFPPEKLLAQSAINSMLVDINKELAPLIIHKFNEAIANNK